METMLKQKSLRYLCWIVAHCDTIEFFFAVKKISLIVSYRKVFRKWPR